MPTIPQINAAKLQLAPVTDPVSYDAATSHLTDDSVSTLHKFLRKYLYDTKKTGRYADSAIATNLAAAVGIDAAQLQAVLNNVSAAGSKKALLKGEVEYSTQETIDNELEFALLVLFVPVIGNYFGGSVASDMARAIRAEFSGRPGCCGDEYQQTRCK